MATPTKKTPKKEKEETPKAATPLRATITRAAARQARLKTALSEEKRKEGDRDTTTRKATTPRKTRVVKDKESSSDLEDKHVKWEDEKGSGEDEDSDRIEEVESAEEQGEHTSKKEEVTIKEVHHIEVTKHIHPTDAEDEKEKEDEHQLHKRVGRREEVKEEAAAQKQADSSHHIKQEDTSAYKQEETTPGSSSDVREDALLQKYNQQWAAENQRRERATELERRRRERASKRIECELQTAIEEQHKRKEVGKPNRSSQRSSASSSSLFPTAYTSVKLEAVQEDKTDDELDEEEVERLKTKIYKLEGKTTAQNTQLTEKDELIRVLEQTANHLQDKLESGASAFTEARKIYENEIKNLKSSQAANQTSINNINAEQFSIERDLLERRIGELAAEVEARDIRLREYEHQAAEFKVAVENGVRSEIRRMKTARKNRQNGAPTQSAIMTPFTGIPTSAVTRSDTHTTAHELPPHIDQPFAHGKLSDEQQAEGGDEEQEMQRDREEQRTQGDREEEEREEGDKVKEDTVDDEEAEQEEYDERKRKREDEQNEEHNNKTQAEEGLSDEDITETEVEPAEPQAFENVEGEPPRVVIGRKIRRILPYAKQGAAMVAVCSIVGAMHYANEMSRFAPEAMQYLR